MTIKIPTELWGHEVWWDHCSDEETEMQDTLEDWETDPLPWLLTLTLAASFESLFDLLTCQDLCILLGLAFC